MQMLRLPCRHPGSLRLHLRPGTNLRPRFASTTGGPCSPWTWDFIARHPRPDLRWNNKGLPGSWGTPCEHALLSDPGGTSTSGHCDASMLPSTNLTASAPATLSFRGSITRPARSLCTLRRVRYRTPRNTRFRLLAKLCRVGVITHRVPLKGFAVKFLLIQASLAHENRRRRDAVRELGSVTIEPIRDSQRNRDAVLRKSSKRTRTCHTRCPVPPFQLGDAVGVTGRDRDVRPSEDQGFGLPSSSSSKVRSSSALDLPRPY